MGSERGRFFLASKVNLYAIAGILSISANFNKRTHNIVFMRDKT
jgi:hypothetical protein